MLKGSANNWVLVSTESGSVCVPPWKACSLSRLKRRGPGSLCYMWVLCVAVCVSSHASVLCICVSVFLSLGHVPCFATGWSSSCIPQCEQRLSPGHWPGLQQLGSRNPSWSSWSRRSRFLCHSTVLWQHLLTWLFYIERLMAVGRQVPKSSGKTSLFLLKPENCHTYTQAGTAWQINVTGHPQKSHFHRWSWYINFHGCC